MSAHQEDGTTPRASTVPAGPGRSVTPSARDSEDPPSARFDGEDFLFHLYRGSELLQDNCVAEAKEELERALKMQPRDVEGQGLLGVVYFRLGLYPRAIEIYRDLVRECPDEVTPKLNLALCYFKTGQPGEARTLLEDVLAKTHDHARAWGYLGLAFERLGEYKKAQGAFERANQPHLARRMQKLVEDLAAVPDEADPAREELRRAASDAVAELEASAQEPVFSRAPSLPSDAQPVGRWQALEPGGAAPSQTSAHPPSLVGRFGPAVPALGDHTEITAAREVPSGEHIAPAPSAPRSPATLIQERRAPDVSGPARSVDGLIFLRVQESFGLRTDRLRALSPDGQSFKTRPLWRRARGHETPEPFGASGSHWIALDGTGLLLLEPPRGRELVVLELSGEFVYVRETRLVAFDGALRYENGRLAAADPGPIPMVHFTGRGALVFEAHAGLRALDVSARRPLTVRAASVIGWTGRLLGQAVPASDAPSLGAGFVVFNGEGAVLVDDP